MKTVFLALIRAYQYLLRPMLAATAGSIPAVPITRARRSNGMARCAACGSPSGVSRAATRIIRGLRPRSLAFPTRRARVKRRGMQRPVMDTRRIILFVIFSFSVLFLWQAWQQENAPRPAEVGRRARAGRDTHADRRRTCRCRRPCPRRRGRRRPPRASRRRAARRSRRRPEDHDHDDLYTAEVDTAGGVSRSCRSASTATRRHPPSRTSRCNGRRSARCRAGRPDRRRPAQPPHAVRSAARAARACARRGPRRVEAQGAGPNGDVVTQVLTFHRGSYLIDAAFDVRTRRRADLALRVFQLTRDTKQAIVQSSMAPRPTSARSSTTTKDNFKKVEFGDIDKLAADPARKSPFQKTADNGWVGMMSTTSSPRGCLRREEDAARVLHAETRQRPLRAASSCRWQIAPARPARCACRCTSPAGPGRAREDREGLDSSSTTASSPCSPPLFWLLKWLHAPPQLGVGDHRDDHHDQGGVLPLKRRCALDGR